MDQMRWVFSLGLFAIMGPLGVAGEHVPDVPAEVLAYFSAIDSHPDKRLLAAAKGRERAVLCSFCHGEDGNSLRPDIPHLAGQNPVYLLEQFEHFGTGLRQNYVMQELAKSLSAEEKVNLALYYASRTIRPAAATDSALSGIGREQFRSKCAACHGDGGRGNKGYAYLAGQQPEYLRRALQRFRDQPEQRRSLLMSSVTRELSDGQIEALAVFLSSLR